MAPELAAAPAVETATAQAWEKNLARTAARTLRQPHKSPKEIVDDVLARLQKVKRRRQLSGNNHWEGFAPVYVAEMLARHEYRRRRAVEAFFRTERSKAISWAEARLRNHCEAEDAVSAAFLQLLAGKTGPSHFYRLLLQVCIWKKRANVSAAKVFGTGRTAGLHEDSAAQLDAPSTLLSQGDPLDILLRAEAIQEGIREVKTMRKHRRHRQTDWWLELMGHYRPDEVAQKRRAQAHI